MGINPISGGSAPVMDFAPVPAAPRDASTATPTSPPPAVTAVAARAAAEALQPVTVQKAPSTPKVDVEPIRSDVSMEFKWNDSANRLVVVMMDKSSGTVIQQLPPQQVLDLVRDAVKATQRELHR